MSDNEDKESGELLHRFQRGDSAAFDELYERHGVTLRGLVWVIVKRADESRLDDLTQKVWTAVIESAAKFERGRDFRAWLAGIARNICLKDCRARKRDRGERDETERSNDEDEVDRAALRADVWAMVAALPPEEREILELKDERDLSFTEISERTGVPLRTVHDRFQRAMNKMRPRLKAWASWSRKGRDK